MRTALVVVYACVAFASSACVATAQPEQEKPPVKPHHHVKRPDPENATMPEKKDWISQTLGDVLDGIDDLGKPLRDQQR